MMRINPALLTFKSLWIEYLKQPKNAFLFLIPFHLRPATLGGMRNVREPKENKTGLEENT